ncbi:hypothetical protein P3S67_026044 [Capsicum chacoense]
MNGEDWFLSPSLEGLLNPPKSPKKSIMEYPPVSILLGLPNGDLLVIVQEIDVAGPDDACYLSLASLAVSRAGQHSLNVTRHFLQPFSVDAPYFVLLDAKAIPKMINIRPDPQHRSRKDRFLNRNIVASTLGIPLIFIRSFRMSFIIHL